MRSVLQPPLQIRNGSFSRTGIADFRQINAGQFVGQRPPVGRKRPESLKRPFLTFKDRDFR